MRLKLTVAYDGTGFRGWARQPGERTVEGVLARGARAASIASSGELAVAGRTDTGVHALGERRLGRRRRRPAARARRRGAERRAAARRRGRRAPRRRRPSSTRASRRGRARIATGIWRRRERSPFEVRPRRSGIRARSTSQRLNASAAMLVGEHDFRAFTPTETQHQVFVRTSRTPAGTTRGDAVEFEITADSFLRHMVRTLVGTMLERDPDELRRAPAGRARAPTPARPRRRGGSTSSASATLSRCGPVDGGLATIGRDALSGRPLRSRRHRRRLRRDHPRLDAARDAHRARAGDLRTRS